MLMRGKVSRKGAKEAKKDLSFASFAPLRLCGENLSGCNDSGAGEAIVNGVTFAAQKSEEDADTGGQ